MKVLDPRLPWGMALKSFKKDPRPLVPILEQLKTIHEPYVQRSVANHLNDISKDHPELVLDLAQALVWAASSHNWIIKHALRGLLKQAHPRALSLFGLQQLPLQLQLRLINAKVTADSCCILLSSCQVHAQLEAKLSG